MEPMTEREAIEAELGYVRWQLHEVVRQGAEEHDTIRLMWANRQKALEDELAAL